MRCGWIEYLQRIVLLKAVRFQLMAFERKAACFVPAVRTYDYEGESHCTFGFSYNTFSKGMNLNEARLKGEFETRSQVRRVCGVQ